MILSFLNTVTESSVLLILAALLRDASTWCIIRNKTHHGSVLYHALRKPCFGAHDRNRGTREAFYVASDEVVGFHLVGADGNKTILVIFPFEARSAQRVLTRKPHERRGVGTTCKDRLSVHKVQRIRFDAALYFDSTLFLFFKNTLVKKEIVNVHSQDAVVIVIGLHNIFCNNDLLERVVNLSERSDFLSSFCFIRQRIC